MRSIPSHCSEIEMVPFHSILYCSSLYQQSNESHSEINFGRFIFCRDFQDKLAEAMCSQMVWIYQSIDPLEWWWWWRWWRINSKKMTNVCPGLLTGAGVS